MKKFFVAVAFIVAVCLYCGYLYVSSELEFLKTYVPEMNIPVSYSKDIKVTVFDADGLEMFQHYYQRGKILPKEYDMTRLIFMTEMIISDKSSDKYWQGIDYLKLLLIKSRGIDPFSLQGVVLNHYADILLEENNLSGFRGEIVRWYTLSKLKNVYSYDELYRMYLDTSYFGENIYGITAACEYYFGKTIEESSALEIAFLIAMISKDKTITPNTDYSYLDKYARVTLRKLYEAFLLSPEEYSYEVSRSVDVLERTYHVAEPSYVEEVLKIVESDKRFKLGKESLKIYTGYSRYATDIARKVVENSLADKDGKLQMSFVLVNRETGSVEAVVGSRLTESKYNRAISLRRQMASTFKPIVYMTAFEAGIKPSDHIIDKPYSFKASNYIYTPKNYEDFFMGDIPLRYGLVYSLNNATIRLAEIVGLKRVRKMALDIGMKGTIFPVHAMALGSFATTPLNVAQMYSTIGNYGERRLPSLVLRVEAENGEIYDMREEPKRVVSQESAFQILYIMQDVVKQGTARGAKMLNGTAAKTGTSDNYRDAWTVALFGPYVAVCWVGFDDYRSMGEEGSGGRIAAPVIAQFQREFFPEGTSFKWQVPKGIELHRVNRLTGLLVESKGRNTYVEAYHKDRLPKKEVKTAQGNY